MLVGYKALSGIMQHRFAVTLIPGRMRYTIWKDMEKELRKFTELFLYFNFVVRTASSRVLGPHVLPTSTFLWVI